MSIFNLKGRQVNVNNNTVRVDTGGCGMALTKNVATDNDVFIATVASRKSDLHQNGFVGIVWSPTDEILNHGLGTRVGGFGYYMSGDIFGFSEQIRVSPWVVGDSVAVSLKGGALAFYLNGVLVYSVPVIAEKYYFAVGSNSGDIVHECRYMSVKKPSLSWWQKALAFFGL